MLNISGRCAYCKRMDVPHDTPYMDCTAPEDYRFKKECPYFEPSDEQFKNINFDEE